MTPSGSPLIFDRPEVQAKRQRFLYSTITLAAWIVWMYLWLPLVTLIAWYLGVRTFVREITLPDPRTMMMTGMVYLVVVVVMGTALIVWSRYNLRRFGGEDRRQGVRFAQDAEIRTMFALSIDDLARFRQGDSLEIAHDGEGRVLAVREQGTVEPPPPPASTEAPPSLPV